MPPTQSRKRAAPEADEAHGLEAQQPEAAAAVETADQHPAPPPGGAPAMPASPGRNRQLFLAQMTPQHMTCDLSTAVVGLGVKHNLQAILVACYPLQKGPPARRHVTLCDQHGATGNPPPYNTACSLSHSGDQGSRCGTPTSTNSPKVISVHQSPSPGLQSHCTRGRRA